MLTSYTKTVWVNGQAPARNDTNLNNQENGIYNVTEETIEQAQQILDLASPATVNYVPQAVNPAYAEGKVFYDDNSHTLSLYNDIEDMVLNLGLETIVRVYNNTGVVIPNGTPLHFTGEVVGGIPSVVPAIADTIPNAVCNSVTTHEILNTEEGFATLIGTVSNVNLSAFNVGDRLFLSDTVAGAYVNIAPDIATSVGVVLVGGTTGKLLVKTRSLINLPNISAFMQDLTNTDVPISATPTKFAGYLEEEGIILEGDTVNGIFTVPYNGLYEIKTSFVVTGITASNNAQYIDIHMRINESAVDEKVFPLTIGRNGSETSGTPFFEVHLVAGDTVSLWHSSPQVTETVSVDTVTFSITSLNLRN